MTTGWTPWSPWTSCRRPDSIKCVDPPIRIRNRSCPCPLQSDIFLDCVPNEGDEPITDEKQTEECGGCLYKTDLATMNCDYCLSIHLINGKFSCMILFIHDILPCIGVFGDLPSTWGPWGNWSACPDDPCESYVVKTRTRECLNDDEDPCVGHDLDFMNQEDRKCDNCPDECREVCFAGQCSQVGLCSGPASSGSNRSCGPIQIRPEVVFLRPLMLILLAFMITGASINP